MDEKSIRDAYVKIRTIDNTIPDEVLDFMFNCSIRMIRKGCLDEKQKLIDFKNKLLDESRLAYDYASIETDKIKESEYNTESKLKEKIAKEISEIVYLK